MHSKKELISNILKSLKELKEYSLEDAEALFTYLYSPNPKLKVYLDELKQAIDGKTKTRGYNKKVGQLMEQVTYLAFSGIEGITSIKSFQSPGPQYDLIVTGDTPDWFTLCGVFYLDENNRDFLIEAKATKKKVSDQQFARLCSLLQMNLNKTAGLGVFFTLEGATGFPEDIERRQRGLRDARLRQAMFMAAHEKPIIVFNKFEIFELNKPGSLVKFIIQKIRDAEQLSGIAKEPADIHKPVECDLPKHLSELL